MFSAIGWVWIEEPPYRDDLDELTTHPRSQTLRAVASLVEPFAELPDQRRQLTWRERLTGRHAPHRVNATIPPQARLESSNDIHAVIIHTHRNHHSQWPEQLFADLALAAAGSFGFLHIHDDEADSARFRRWSMAHGQVMVQPEPALEPISELWDDLGNA